MKKRFLLFAILFFVCGFTLTAAEKEIRQASQRDSLYWEKVIEAYSDFCRLYDDAKSKGVSSSVALERKASDIKALLSESHGKMSSEQYRRFEKLRERYSGIPVFSGVGETAAQVTKVVKEVRHITDTVVIIKEIGRKDTVWIASEDTDDGRVKPLPVVDPSPSSGVQAFSLSRPSSIVTTPQPDYYEIRKLNGSYYVLHDGQWQRIGFPSCYRFGFTVIPDILGGGAKIGCGFRYYRRAGVYVDLNDIFAAEFRLKSDYSCTSDGTTSYGKIWTTGKKRASLFSVTGGGIFCLDSHWSLYAGAGYGNWNYQWEDVDSRWVEVSDLSYKGLVLETSVAFSFGAVGVSAGVQTLEFKRYVPKITLFAGF